MIFQTHQASYLFIYLLTTLISNRIKQLQKLVNKDLNWKYHIREILKKLARTCDMFFKIRRVLVFLYYSLFASFLQYGIVVWGPTHDT